MYPGAHAAVFFPHGDRVVEVLRRFRIDREGRQIPEIDATLEQGLRWLVRLELHSGARVHEQPFQHRLDVVRVAEDPLELRAAASRPDNGEVATSGTSESLAVENERRAGNEVRLADDELAALRDLDDDPVR